MARVEFFIFSDGSQVEQLQGPDGKTQQRVVIQNPQYVLRPLFVPSLFSFTISFAISDFDVKATNTIRVTFSFSEDPDTLIFDSGLFQLAPTTEDEYDVLPDHLRGINANVDVRNVPIRQNGKYQSDIYFNDEKLGTYSVEVWRREEV